MLDERIRTLEPSWDRTGAIPLKPHKKRRKYGIVAEGAYEILRDAVEPMMRVRWQRPFLSKSGSSDPRSRIWPN